MTTIDECTICGRTASNHSNPNTDYRGMNGDAPPTDHYYFALDDGVESKASEVNYDYNNIEGGSTIEYYGYDSRTGNADGSIKKGKAQLKGPAGWVVGSGNGTIVDERSFISSESKASEGYVVFDKNDVTIERHDEEWEAEVQADSIGGYVQKEETSGGDLGGIIYDARESKANEDVTFAGRGNIVTYEDLWGMLDFGSRLSIAYGHIMNQTSDNDFAMLIINSEPEQLSDNHRDWIKSAIDNKGGIDQVKQSMGVESKASEVGTWADIERDEGQSMSLLARNVWIQDHFNELSSEDFTRLADDASNNIEPDWTQTATVYGAPESKASEGMLHANCFSCGNTFKTIDEKKSENCPKCGSDMITYSHNESKASEYSIKEEFDLQDQDGKYEMLSKADLSVTDATNYSTYSHDELPEEVKDSLKGDDEDSFGESWNQKSSINRIESLESVGIKQGDAIKLSGLEFEDFGEDLQGALKGDLEDARREMKSDKDTLDKTDPLEPSYSFQWQQGGEVENPNSEFDQSYPDYNNIGESQTSMTSYECEFCDNGFKSNEALSIHHNDKHAIAPESLDGYASELHEENGFTISGNSARCNRCGWVFGKDDGEEWKGLARHEEDHQMEGDQFNRMAYEPNIGAGSHESKASEIEYNQFGWDNWKCNYCGVFGKLADGAVKHYDETGHPNILPTGESKASETFTATDEEVLDYLRDNPYQNATEIMHGLGWDGVEDTDVHIMSLYRSGKIETQNGGYVVNESKASEDVTFADTTPRTSIQKDMIEFIRRRGGSASELDIDREFDLLNNFNNESRHLQALVNDGTLTSAGWQPDNSGNDGYPDGSYLYNLNESYSSETEDYWDYRDQGNPPDDWVNWYKCKTCGQSRMDDGTDSMNTVDQHRRDNPTHRIEWTNATEESYSSERDPSSYSDGYLQAGRRKLLKKAKEDEVCPVCAEKWDGSEDFWEIHFVNKHRLNESKASEDVTFGHSYDTQDAWTDDMLLDVLKHKASFDMPLTDMNVTNQEWDAFHRQSGSPTTDVGSTPMGDRGSKNNLYGIYNDPVLPSPESKANEDFGNAQQKWNSLGWMGRSNVLKKVGLDNISPDTNVWELNSNDWDIISAELIDYDTESKASEAGAEDHGCAECGFTTSDNSEYIDHLNSHEV